MQHLHSTYIMLLFHQQVLKLDFLQHLYKLFTGFFVSIYWYDTRQHIPSKCLSICQAILPPVDVYNIRAA